MSNPILIFYVSTEDPHLHQRRCHYAEADKKVIQEAIDNYSTTAKVTEILADLPDLCKNNRNTDENNEKDRPLERPLHRPFKQRRTTAEAKKTGATTKELLNLEWKASKETTDEKNKTGKKPFGDSQNQMQK
jgi:hypothetical protein